MPAPPSSLQRALSSPSLLYDPRSGHLLGSLLSSVVGNTAPVRRARFATLASASTSPSRRSAAKFGVSVAVSTTSYYYMSTLLIGR
jgi:hypothetical protein